jgi:hypothetical protein
MHFHTLFTSQYEGPKQLTELRESVHPITLPTVNNNNSNNDNNSSENSVKKMTTLQVREEYSQRLYYEYSNSFSGVVDLCWKFFMNIATFKVNLNRVKDPRISIDAFQCAATLSRVIGEMIRYILYRFKSLYSSYFRYISSLLILQPSCKTRQGTKNKYMRIRNLIQMYMLSPIVALFLSSQRSNILI